MRVQREEELVWFKFSSGLSKERVTWVGSWGINEIFKGRIELRKLSRWRRGKNHKSKPIRWNKNIVGTVKHAGLLVWSELLGGAEK
jgi:hypothetical protein